MKIPKVGKIIITLLLFASGVAGAASLKRLLLGDFLGALTDALVSWIFLALAYHEYNELKAGQN